MGEADYKSLLDSRAAEKSDARASDRARIKAGVNPVQIQKENSAINGDYIRSQPISNFAEAMDW